MFKFDYVVLEAACHSISFYVERLQMAVNNKHLDLSNPAFECFQIQGYRALIELVLTRRCLVDQTRKAMIDGLKSSGANVKLRSKFNFSKLVKN